MLPRFSRQNLCRACRCELQSLFEGGFSGPAPIASAFRSHGLRRQQNVSDSIRILQNYLMRRFTNHVSRRYEHGKLKTEQEETRDQQLRPSKQAVIEVLGRKLAGSLAQEVGENQHAVRSLMQAHAIDAIEQHNPTSDLNRSSIEELRSTGASNEDVAIEARRIYRDSLPDNLLTLAERNIYVRLYGEPARYGDEEPEAVESTEAVPIDTTSPIHDLYTAHGHQITYVLESSDNTDPPIQSPRQLSLVSESSAEKDDVAQSLDPDHNSVHNIISSVHGQISEPNYDTDDLEIESTGERGHPMTILGKFSTSPRTVFMPQDEFVRPVEQIMSYFSNKHLKEISEKTFGGPGLPDSPLTPRSGRTRQQVPIPLNAGQNTMGEMEANAFVSAVMPPTYASIIAVLTETRKRLGKTWLSDLLAKQGGPRILDAGAGGAGIIAWRQIVKAHWDALEDKPSEEAPESKSVVLTGSDTLRHRAAALLANTTFVPRLPDYSSVRDGPTLDDDRPAQQKKQFDVIIASHALFGLKEDWMRKQLVQNLWSQLSADAGVLILIEKGTPRGFEVIAGARELLLERHIAAPEGQETSYSQGPATDLVHQKEVGTIVAPCTNHERCPMYKTGGVSRGRKDVCSFSQRYIRPKVLQRVLGASERNHDDVDFSYLAVMKGEDLRYRQLVSYEDMRDPIAVASHSDPSILSEGYETWLDNVQLGFEDYRPPETEPTSTTATNSSIEVEVEVEHPDGLNRPYGPAGHRLPRLILPPIKNQGHVIMDVCTPAGQIERWTVPRSFSKQAYRDARKAGWGDLWALGAKTRRPRALRLGTPEKDIMSKKKAGGGQSRREQLLQMQAEQLIEAREQDALDEQLEARELEKELDDELAMQDLFDDNDQAPDRRDRSGRQSATAGNTKNRRRDRYIDYALSRSKQTSSSAAHRHPIQGRPQRQASPLQYTPGPDDPDISDAEVARVLAEWQAEYDGDRPGAGTERSGRRHSHRQK